MTRRFRRSLTSGEPKSSRRSGRAVALFGFLSLVAAGTGISVAIAESESASPTQQFNLPPDRYVTDTTDQSPGDFKRVAPGAILDELLKRNTGDAIISARIDGPPPGFQPTEGGKPAPATFATGKWAYMTVAAQSDSYLADKPLWEAGLILGALRDGMHMNGDYLYGAEISLQLPDGSTVPDVGSCCGNVVYDQHFDSPAAAEIPGKIREAASSLGLAVQTIDVLNIDQPAPAVVATTDEDARTFLAGTASKLSEGLFGQSPGRPEYEAYYVEVRTSDGVPLLILMANSRTGISTLWVPDKYICDVPDTIQPYKCAHTSG